MKDKIIVFIIGVLVGAVLSTGAFYIYTRVSGNNSNNTQLNGGQPPEMPNGENGQPPEKPDGDNTGEPPAKPEDNNKENEDN